jgi:hypothetical protein
MFSQTEARWRGEPPCLKQLDTLRKLKIRITPGLTKGQASDLISTFWAAKTVKQHGYRR